MIEEQYQDENGVWHTKQCGNCKWMNQDKNCCRCYNPEQTDPDYIRYTYWPFCCPLFTAGSRPTDAEMKELGYKRAQEKTLMADGSTHTTNYWEKL